MYILKKIVYIKYIELCKFFETLYTLNIQNFINSLNNWIFNVHTLQSQ